MKRKRKKIRELALFGLFSLLGTGVDVGLLLMIKTLLPIGVANAISYWIGVVTSFLLNRRYAFKMKDKIAQRAVLTVLTHMVGCLAQTLCVLCIDNAILAKVIGIIINGVIMYIGTVYIVFRKNDVSES